MPTTRYWRTLSSAGSGWIDWGPSLEVVVRAAYIGLAVALCVKCLLRPAEHTVWPVYALASQNWWQDRSLYARYPAVDLYRYWPTFAIFFTPFAWLGSQVGAILWAVLNVALLWRALGMVRDRILGSPGSRQLFMLLALLGASGGLWSSQTNAMIVACLLLGLVAAEYQRWWAAAGLLAWPVFIKLWPAVAVMVPIVYWPRQLAWRIGILAAALALVPALTRPAGIVAWQYQQWIASLLGPQQGRWPGFRDSLTILEHMGIQVPNMHYRLIELLTMAGLLAWSARYRRLHPPGKGIHGPWYCLAIWSCWQLLLGPGSERLTYGISAPFIAWALLAGLEQGLGRWWIVSAWTLVQLFSWGDIEKTAAQLLPFAPALLPAGVLIFGVWLWAFGKRLRLPAPSTSPRPLPLPDPHPSRPARRIG